MQSLPSSCTTFQLVIKFLFLCSLFTNGLQCYLVLPTCCLFPVFLSLLIRPRPCKMMKTFSSLQRKHLLMFFYAGCYQLNMLDHSLIHISSVIQKLFNKKICSSHLEGGNLRIFLCLPATLMCSKTYINKNLFTFFTYSTTSNFRSAV